jgi:hypothetical protein
VAAAIPEVPVPAATQERWSAALTAAAAEQRATPPKRTRVTQPRWLAFAAAATVAVIALVATFRPTDPPSTPVAVNDPPPGNGAVDASAYEQGLKWHLASTERQLADMSSASPEERARLIEAIIGQNRIYALAAERAGEPQLARVLRAFTPILQDVASGRAQSTEGSLAQLSFELRVMQSRLGADAPGQSNTL